MQNTQKRDDRNTGQIIEIKGVVIDAVFTDTLPEILNALEIEIPRSDGSSFTLVAEVQQHLGDDRVRAVAMDSTDGLSRGADVVDTGAPISVPVGQATLGRIWNVIGQAVDEKPEPANMERWSIHREPPAFRELSPTVEIFETGIKVHRSDRALHQGRQGRPLRRRRRRQDRADHGADPQPRQAARRPLRLRRRGRADARGQRPLPRDERVGRDRQDALVYGQMNEPPGRAPARRASRA